MLYCLSVFFIAALSLVTPATAATDVGGTIATTTWTKALSPYRVTGTITVPPNNTLTIEPGVDVLFDADVQFIVQGKLYAVGTGADSIRFIKGSAAQWGGLTLSEGDTSTLSYVRISDVSNVRAALKLMTSARVGITNVQISQNRGGGVHLEDGSTATLENCTITSNKVSYFGGGLYAESSSTATLENCMITGNLAYYSGGGVRASSSTVTMANCTISGNSAVGWGGGLDAYSSTVTLTNCTITGNLARYGGGLYATFSSTATLTNCTITSNKVSYFGGGLFAYSSTVRLTNCTITSNKASYFGGGFVYNDNSARLTMTNSILWANSAPEIRRQSGTITVQYSDVQGGIPSDVTDGGGNINADPLFVNAGNGDYHLQAGSPCIDAGDPNSPPDPDMTQADMGALPYGFPSRRARRQ